MVLMLAIISGNIDTLMFGKQRDHPAEINQSTRPIEIIAEECEHGVKNNVQVETFG